jgi:signal transduction histidine kinase
MKDGQETREQLMDHLPDLRQRFPNVEEKKAEGAEMNAILDAMTDYVCIIDEAHNIKYVNTIITKELGPVGNLKCFEYFHNLSEECPWCKNREVFSGATVRQDRYSSRTGKTYDVINTPLRNKDGGIDKLVILRDISERKHAEDELKHLSEELKRSNADLQQFAYAASHDLQEPLRVIAGFIKRLEKRYKDKLDEKAHEFIDYAVDGVRRMQMLIRDLLAYSQVETKGKRFTPTNCAEVLEQALFSLQSSIEESGAEVTCDILPSVMADASQLSRLFQNLIGNAIKFHGKDLPRIHVASEHRDNEWVFSVRDNGIGIDPKYFDRIFVVFQRLHTREEYDGTGIGLSICKKIVERHGGRFWVESEPGKGSTFYFSIPDRQQTPAESLPVTETRCIPSAQPPAAVNPPQLELAGRLC